MLNIALKCMYVEMKHQDIHNFWSFDAYVGWLCYFSTCLYLKIISILNFITEIKYMQNDKVGILDFSREIKPIGDTHTKMETHTFIWRLRSPTIYHWSWRPRKTRRAILSPKSWKSGSKENYGFQELSKPMILYFIGSKWHTVFSHFWNWTTAHNQVIRSFLSVQK